MRVATRWCLVAVTFVAVVVAACQSPSSTPSTSGSDLTGTVTSANGAQAGVWVIAETTNLPTKFSKIGVTDEYDQYALNTPRFFRGLTSL